MFPNISYLTSGLANIVPALLRGSGESPNLVEEHGRLHGTAVRQRGRPRWEGNQIAAHVGVRGDLHLGGMSSRQDKSRRRMCIQFQTALVKIPFCGMKQTISFEEMEQHFVIPATWITCSSHE